MRYESTFYLFSCAYYPVLFGYFIWTCWYNKLLFFKNLKVFNDEYKSLNLCYVSITNFKKMSKKLKPYELNLTWYIKFDHLIN